MFFSRFQRLKLQVQQQLKLQAQQRLKPQVQQRLKTQVQQRLGKILFIESNLKKL